MIAVPPVLLLLTGAVTLRLTLTGAYTSYVRVGMFWLLIVSGVLLTYLGLAALWRLYGSTAAHAGPDDDDDGGHGHGHAHAGVPGVAFLLLLPMLVAYAVAPPSLGAFSAQQAAGSVLPDERRGFAALTPGPDGVSDLKLGEAVRRALYDEAQSLSGQRVRLVGFVVPGEQAGTVLLTRFVIRCCAADGTPAQVELAMPPAAGPLPDDTWVEVVAGFQGATDGEPPRFVAESVRQVGPPDDPYEV